MNVGLERRADLTAPPRIRGRRDYFDGWNEAPPIIVLLHFSCVARFLFKLLLNISHQQFVLMPVLQNSILTAKFLGFLKYPNKAKVENIRYLGFVKVKVPNLWEYLFLTCITVAFLDHWNLSLVSGVVGREHGGTPFPHFFHGGLVLVPTLMV